MSVRRYSLAEATTLAGLTPRQVDALVDERLLRGQWTIAGWQITLGQLRDAWRRYQISNAGRMARDQYGTTTAGNWPSRKVPMEQETIKTAEPLPQALEDMAAELEAQGVNVRAPLAKAWRQVCALPSYAPPPTKDTRVRQLKTAFALRRVADAMAEDDPATAGEARALAQRIIDGLVRELDERRAGAA